jgi:hypothetical protein
MACLCFQTQAKRELAKAKKLLKAYRETPEAIAEKRKGMGDGLKNLFEKGGTGPGLGGGESQSQPKKGSGESAGLMTATEKLAELEKQQRPMTPKDSSGSSSGGGSPKSGGSGKKKGSGGKKSPKANKPKLGTKADADDLRKLHDEMPSDVNALLAKMANEAGIDIKDLPGLMAGYDQKTAGGLNAQAAGGGLGADVAGLDSLEKELNAMEAQLN